MSAKTNAGRRKFMTTLGLSGAAAAAAVLTSTAGKQAQERAESDDVAGNRGYRLTGHVRRYYDTTRI